MLALRVSAQTWNAYMAKSNINRGESFPPLARMALYLTWKPVRVQSLFTREVENSRHNNSSKIIVRSNISLITSNISLLTSVDWFFCSVWGLHVPWHDEWFIPWKLNIWILYYENLDLVELWLPTGLPLTPCGGGFVCPWWRLKSWLTMTPFLQLAGRKQGDVLLHVSRRPGSPCGFHGHCSAGGHSLLPSPVGMAVLALTLPSLGKGNLITLWPG